MKTGVRWQRIGAVIALGLTASLLAGCAGERPDPLAPLDVPRDLAGTPAGSGDLDTVAWNVGTGEPASLDWIYAYDDSSNTALANMCEGLMRQNEQMELEPGLAESVDHPDDLTSVFTLRSGVTFWDGSPLTADDVVFSLERHLDADAGSYWGVPFYDNVDSISATGPLEVTITFSQPDALFERMLATPAGVVGSREYTQEAGEAYGTAQGGVMCTGPFEFDSWRSGTSIAMVKNEDYWDRELVPMADRLELSFITDETTVTNSLLSGSIDGAYNPPLSATELLANSDSGSFVLGKSTDWLAIRPTEVDGPMRKLEMRQALSSILDRRAVAGAVFRGTATPASTPIQPGAWGYAHDAWAAAAEGLPGLEFDLDEAKRLVADGDLASDTVSVALPADSEAEAKIAEILRAGAEEAGLSLEFHILPQTSFTELYFDEEARKSYDAFIVQEYGAGVADPIVSMSEFTPLSAYNYGSYDDATLTRSVEQAFANVDPEQRAELLIAGQTRMVEDLPLIPVVNQEHRVYQNDRISGATASRAALYYPWATRIGAAS